jgi:hypothetical protein
MTENIQSKHLFSNHEPENTHTLERTPDDYSMDYQSIYLQTPDGEFLHAYWIYQAEDVHSTPMTLLYLHGAGGNISHRLEVVRLFYDNLRCNILIIDYRGECNAQGEESGRGRQTAGDACHSRMISFRRLHLPALTSRLSHCYSFFLFVKALSSVVLLLLLLPPLLVKGISC